MADRGLQKVVRYLHRTAAIQQHGKLADTELLDRFVRSRDSAAFEVLVWRHGSMVMNVCRRVARREEDAEDGFQATFLTLVRKAHSIGKHASVASWLYKVAFRAALEVKSRARCSEREAAPAVSAQFGPFEEAVGRELQEVLDDEVIRLPEKYRTALVLCCFEGKTNREIALQLRCPEATVRTRLARARERLRMRLDRRGLGVSASALAIALAPPLGRTASAALVSSTIDLALGSVSSGKSSIVRDPGRRKGDKNHVPSIDKAVCGRGSDRGRAWRRGRHFRS